MSAPLPGANHWSAPKRANPNRHAPEPPREPARTNDATAVATATLAAPTLPPSPAVHAGQGGELLSFQCLDQTSLAVTFEQEISQSFHERKPAEHADAWSELNPQLKTTRTKIHVRARQTKGGDLQAVASAESQPGDDHALGDLFDFSLLQDSSDQNNQRRPNPLDDEPPSDLTVPPSAPNPTWHADDATAYPRRQEGDVM